MIYLIHKSSKGIIQLHIDISYYLSAELCPASLLLLPRSNSGSDAWPRLPYSLLLLAARAGERGAERAACVATFEWGRQRQERDEDGEDGEEKGKEDRDRADSVTQLGYVKAVQVK